ncbi:4796_t:CDS:2 [Dentiscutata erythropus]|uniref:4796_t:CDS:1 n=1 Tax=Dentiscutata erythropus TaxID=1348616 RepID=A0A9N9NIP9_9GLOM|nr:4796_t:CDS:2 [Dentiscutata erythropus]
MKLDNFSLEILVNDKPLPEFNERVSDDNVITTGPSYTRKKIDSPEEPSSLTHYAAVQEFGTRYAVRFSVTSSCCITESPMKVYVYVDGKFDHTYTELNPTKLSETRTCFWSKNRDKMYYFKFDPTIWSEEKNEINDDDSNQKRGGSGAISAYFYQAKRVPRNGTGPPDYNVESAIIPENKDTRSIKLATQYDVVQVPNPTIPRSNTYLQEKGNPLAVLHLHYRAADLLRVRGHDVPYSHPANHINNTGLEHNGVKRERKIKETPDDEVIILSDRKRHKKDEVIVISSDDDED